MANIDLVHKRFELEQKVKLTEIELMKRQLDLKSA